MLRRAQDVSIHLMWLGRRLLVTGGEGRTIQLTLWSYAASVWEFWEGGRLMMAGALKEGSRKGST